MMLEFTYLAQVLVSVQSILQIVFAIYNKLKRCSTFEQYEEPFVSCTYYSYFGASISAHTSRSNNFSWRMRTRLVPF